MRFEGPGIFGGSTVRGHLHEARITVLDGGTVLPRHLNKHPCDDFNGHTGSDGKLFLGKDCPAPASCP